MIQRVLISAGAGGIGLSMARLFAQSGAEIWIADCDGEAISKLPSCWERTNLDVTAQNDVEAMFEHIKNKWGRLDVLCANAGIAGPTAPVEEISLPDWRRCISVNLDGAFLFAKGAIRLMKPAKNGSILFMSSTAGMFGYPNRSSYCASKWAMIGLMKTLAMELGPLGIRANAICPGSVDGDRMERVLSKDAQLHGINREKMYATYSLGNSMKTFVSEEDVANMAVFLSSQGAKKISGQVIAVDGHTENPYPRL